MCIYKEIIHSYAIVNQQNMKSTNQGKRQINMASPKLYSSKETLGLPVSAKQSRELKRTSLLSLQQEKSWRDRKSVTLLEPNGELRSWANKHPENCRQAPVAGRNRTPASATQDS